MKNKLRNEHFINPYNFVPLQTKATKNALQDNQKLFSGVIDYSIRTKTPLFIPNTSHDDALNVSHLVKEQNGNKHKSYDFFSYTNLEDKAPDTVSRPSRPVIPGSEIRGMIRSNYEIISNSCMSALDTDMKLSKRTSQAFNCGLLGFEDGKFNLYEANSRSTGYRLYHGKNLDYNYKAEENGLEREDG